MVHCVWLDTMWQTDVAGSRLHLTLMSADIGRGTDSNFRKVGTMVLQKVVQQAQ